jgi:hypothetical protein
LNSTGIDKQFEHGDASPGRVDPNSRCFGNTVYLAEVGRAPRTLNRQHRSYEGTRTTPWSVRRGRDSGGWGAPRRSTLSGTVCISYANRVASLNALHQSASAANGPIGMDWSRNDLLGFVHQTGQTLSGLPVLEACFGHSHSRPNVV